jgi:peptide/nickel transport system substrate-binding protein
VACLVALALAAAACGGGGDDSGGGGGGGASGDEGTPTPGGQVVYGLEAETTDGWCLPEAQLAISGIMVARTIYDTLTRPNADGGYDPWLAESVDHNEDYTQWTIKIRDGVKFHDGSDLTAEVVKNNLDAYRGQYEGRNPLLFAIVFDNVANVDVVDPLTVRVTTSTPWVDFDGYLFSSGRLGMMAQAQLDDAEHCSENLIGTGPFKLDEWVPNQHLVAEKNPDYWATDDDGNQLPYLDEIEYRPQPELTQHVNSLRSGEEDVFHMSSNTAAVTLKDMRDLAAKGDINLTESDDFAEVGLLMLNATTPPFDNIKAREAVDLAYNAKELNDSLNLGIPKLANGPFAPGATGYLEDTGYKTSDPEKAKTLVREYEEETGQQLSFTITTGQDTALQRQIDVIKQAFEDVGMKVETTTLEQSALIQKAIEKGYQMITWRNYPGLDPDNLYVWWYGQNNPVNFMGFDDPEVNDLLDRGRETADEGERKTIYEDLNKELNKEHYMLWTTYTIWAMPSAPDVHGFVGARPPDGGSDYTGLALGVDPALIWREQ